MTRSSGDSIKKYYNISFQSPMTNGRCVKCMTHYIAFFFFFSIFRTNNSREILPCKTIINTTNYYIICYRRKRYHNVNTAMDNTIIIDVRR